MYVREGGARININKGKEENLVGAKDKWHEVKRHAATLPYSEDDSSSGPQKLVDLTLLIYGVSLHQIR